MVCRKDKSSGALFLGFFILLVSWAASLFILASVPPVSRDALVHHLAVPKLYIEYGKMIELPCMPYSYYPMNLDLLYMIGLKAGSDIIPKFIHCIFGLLTSGLIYRYLSKKITPVYGVIGALLFLSLPMVIKLCTTAYVDLGLVFFSTASIFSILKWQNSSFQWKYLAWAGFWCGLALGTKYNGLLIFFLLAIFIVFTCARQLISDEYRYRKLVAYTFVFIIFAFAIYSPWMARNIFWTGNPVYPLLGKVFSEKTMPSCEIDAGAGMNDLSSYNHFQYRIIYFGETWMDILFLPVRIFFQGKDDSQQYFDGKLSGLLFIMPFFAFFLNRHGQIGASFIGNSYDKRFFLWFSILFILFSLLIRPVRIRYFAPAFPCLVILSVYGIKQLLDHFARSDNLVEKAFLFLFLFLCAGYTILNAGQYLAKQFLYIKPVKYICGQISRDDYISTFRPEYPLFKLINEELPKSAKIIFFYLGKRGYYCDRRYIPDLGNNLQWMITDLRHKNGIEEFSEKLREKGITHLLMKHAIVDKRLSNVEPALKKKIISFLHEKTIMLKSINGYSLYSLN